MKHFYAYLSRMKLIKRWGLMRNTQPENDMEHALQVAVLAHGMAVFAKTRYGKTVDPEKVMALGVFHDASEVITGDLPTPVKYYNPQIKQEYHHLESIACKQLLQLLPDDMRPAYTTYLLPDESTYEWMLVKAADRMCAYIKCMEELQAGNQEFGQASKTILDSIRAISLPEVQAFFDDFVPSFGLSLDALSVPEVDE